MPRVLVREAGQRRDESSQPFGLGRGLEAESDLMGQRDLHPTAGRRVVRCRLRVEMEGNEQGRLGPCGK